MVLLVVASFIRKKKCATAAAAQNAHDLSALSALPCHLSVCTLAESKSPFPDSFGLASDAECQIAFLI